MTNALSRAARLGINIAVGWGCILGMAGVALVDTLRRRVTR